MIDARAARTSLSPYWPTPAAPRRELSRRFEIRRSGRRRPRIVLVTSRSIPDRDGGIAGWVGTLADVTAEAGAEAAMSAARDAAVAANAMQKNFAASASHELRTPTTSILGYTEEVLESDDALGAGPRVPRDRVPQRAAPEPSDRRPARSSTRPRSEPSMMHIEPTALAPLVDEVIANFSAAAHQRRHHARHRARAGPAARDRRPAAVRAGAHQPDRQRGEVHAERRRDQRRHPRRDGDSVQVTVADTGAGIDPADIDNIFGRFYRTKTARRLRRSRAAVSASRSRSG